MEDEFSSPTSWRSSKNDKKLSFCLKNDISNISAYTFDRIDLVSVFFNHRDIFMEKHWKSVIGRSVCDYFFEAQEKVRI